MSQAQMPKLYERTKRDEMTFGILPDFVPNDLVGNMKGDARLYAPNEVHDLMMEMDAGFAGMRRSTVDKLENLRQLILYTLAGKVVGDTAYWAMYQRAAGAEAQLKDGFSIGFGGHLERLDLASHYVAGPQEGQLMEVPEVPSSFYTTLTSGIRELSEEVRFTSPEGKARPLTEEEQLKVLGAGMGLPAGLTHEKVEAFTDELKQDAMIATDLFILRRDATNPQVGTFFTVGETTTEQLFTEITGKPPISPETAAELNSNVVPCGFISDRDMDKPGFVGNTHLGVIAVFRVKEDMDFKVMEEKYTTIGWKTTAEVIEMIGRCEPWTQFLCEHFEGLEKVLREQCHTEQPRMDQPEGNLADQLAALAANNDTQFPQ
jgi:Predicted phosphoesterase (MutT family)